MRFLICDDDPVIRYLLEVVLGKRGGHDVITVPDSQSVASVAAERRPDLILLDYIMPGLSGADVAAELAAGEKTAGIPIVLLTGRSDVSDEIDFESLGVKGVIEKPFDTSSLSDRLIRLASS
jgi:two-component system phosphate regulon response regulator PhoB